MPKKPLSDYERWLALAHEVTRTDNPLKVPYDVALREAGAAAAFVTKYWEPTATLPGLKSVSARLPKSTADDIISLVSGVQEAQTTLLLLVDPAVVDSGERARFLIDELESALEFLLDDEVEEPADAQLAQIQAFHAQDGQRTSALIQALNDYSSLAASLRDRLAAIDDDFNAAHIDDAKQLAKTLAAEPAKAVPTESAVTAATQIRNKMLHLLTAKVTLVRKCAARVFRRSPEVAREAMSTYERRRRAAARRAKAAQPKADSSAEPVNKDGNSDS